MTDSSANTISVWGIDESGDRGSIGEKISELLFGRHELTLDDLSSQISNTLEKVVKSMERIPQTFGEFEAEEISFSLEISSKGTVSLLGTGGELGGKGGIQFTLKRKK